LIQVDNNAEWFDMSLTAHGNERVIVTRGRSLTIGRGCTKAIDQLFEVIDNCTFALDQMTETGGLFRVMSMSAMMGLCIMRKQSEILMEFFAFSSSRMEQLSSIGSPLVTSYPGRSRSLWPKSAVRESFSIRWFRRDGGRSVCDHHLFRRRSAALPLRPIQDILSLIGAM
jgi:hypothetical protein